jgi:hypothetical protein
MRLWSDVTWLLALGKSLRQLQGSNAAPVYISASHLLLFSPSACSQTPSDMWRQLLDVPSLSKLRFEDLPGTSAAAAGGGLRGGFGQGGRDERRSRQRQAELQVGTKIIF